MKKLLQNFLKGTKIQVCQTDNIKLEIENVYSICIHTEKEQIF